MYTILHFINSEYNNNNMVTVVNRLKRVDLCCHTDEFSVDEKSLKNYQGKFRSNTIIRSNQEIETYSLGSRKKCNLL